MYPLLSILYHKNSLTIFDFGTAICRFSFLFFGFSN